MGICERINKNEAGTKVLASPLSLDCRARRSGWVGSTTLILSAFTALLNCAEVGRRNRILTNDRFLSHSHFFDLSDKENAPRKLQNEEFWSQYRLDLCNYAMCLNFFKSSVNSACSPLLKTCIKRWIFLIWSGSASSIFWRPASVIETR